MGMKVGLDVDVDMDVEVSGRGCRGWEVAVGSMSKEEGESVEVERSLYQSRQ